MNREGIPDRIHKGFDQLKNRIFPNKKTDLTTAHVLRVSKTRTVPSPQQWKRIGTVLSKGEKLIAALALLVMVGSFIFIVSWFVGTHRVEVPAVGGEYTEGLVGEPQFINPLYASASDVDRDLTRLVFSGLFKFDPNSGLVPDLAASYEISEDQTVYTITLRDDAKWHDGEPVRAGDVIFTIQSIQNSEFKSPLAVTFRGITVVEAGEKVVQFILPEPFAPFLSTLTVGILPAHVWEGVAPKRATLAELNLTPIGSGPYKFDKFTKDKKGNIGSYTFVRNEAYYGESPKIETLNFKFYSSAEEALAALENHNVEGLAFVPADLASEAEKIRGVQIVRPLIPQSTAIFFNEEQNDLLAEEQLRQALIHATDKQAIIDSVFSGYATAIDSPILPGMLGYQENPEALAFDPGTTMSLLDELGWTQAEGAPVRTKEIDDETVNLSFTLTTIDQAEFISVAEIVKNQWALVGIELNIRAVPSIDLQAEVLANRNYELFMTGMLLGIDPDPYPFWHSSQIEDPGLNLALYANRKADEILEEARITTNPEDRAAKYQDFVDLLNEDLPALFLYQPTYRYAVAADIQNVVLDRINIPADRFAKINEWYIKTKTILQWQQEEEIIEPEVTEEVTETLSEEIGDVPTAEEVTEETAGIAEDSEAVEEATE